jgi:hypothetical protein
MGKVFDMGKNTDFTPEEQRRLDSARRTKGEHMTDVLKSLIEAYETEIAIEDARIQDAHCRVFISAYRPDRMNEVNEDRIFQRVHRLRKWAERWWYNRGYVAVLSDTFPTIELVELKPIPG